MSVGAYTLMMVVNWLPWRVRWKGLRWSECPRGRLVSLLASVFFNMKPSLERRWSSLLMSDQYKVYPAPCSLIDPCFAKCTLQRAAMWMSSQASSSSTSTEHPCGWSALSESCIVRIFQHANLRLVVSGLCFFFPVWDTHWPVKSPLGGCGRKPCTIGLEVKEAMPSRGTNTTGMPR